MPQIAIKTGFTAADGCEEELVEYICDYPGCPNIATSVLGFARELRQMVAVCEAHVSKQQS